MKAIEKNSTRSEQEFRARHYYNRDISWLKFNFRVYQEGVRRDNLLLERLKYLAIVANNLDEFFEIRVASLEQKLCSDIQEAQSDGLTPATTLKRVYRMVGYLLKKLYFAWNHDIIPGLRDEGYRIVTADEFTSKQLEFVKNYFFDRLFPVLTPIKIDAAHPFPWVINKSLCVAALLRSPDSDEVEVGVISIPRVLPRVIEIPSDEPQEKCFTFITAVVEPFLDALFRGHQIDSFSPFRITRNSNLYLNEEEENDLLKAVEKELMNTRRGDVVRLEIRSSAPPQLIKLLQKFFRLRSDQVNIVDGPVNFNRVMAFYQLIDDARLKESSHKPETPEWLGSENIFDKISEKDMLLHHPYQSFQPVITLLQSAASDPKVLSIKVTLYRMGDDSPIIQALLEAAANGKEVTVVMELMARFDEQSNVTWARYLLEHGVHVVYGLLGYKTHGKMILIVREENNHLEKYIHIGTGNYNENTARLYTDLSLFSRNKEITGDAMEVFNVLTAQSRNPQLKSMLVSPFNMLDQFLEMIENEIEAARAGKPARIIFKMNALQDEGIINALYRASMAGVEIHGIVRGICCLKPGRSNFSENIKIRSIIGRYLEHARIYYFSNHKPYRLYIGSADWMPRNIRRRVETAIPIIDPEIEKQILNEVLEFQLRDNVDARRIGEKWCERDPDSDNYFRSQAEFMKLCSAES